MHLECERQPISNLLWMFGKREEMESMKIWHAIEISGTLRMMKDIIN
jgi:hypothetical protein